MDDFESEHTGFELLELTNNNLTDWFKPFEQTYRYNIKDLDEETEKVIMYINPLQFSRIKTNPFKEESRVFPIDFINPKVTTKTVRISIPSGYKIDEIPENTAFALPNNNPIPPQKLLLHHNDYPNLHTTHRHKSTRTNTNRQK